MQTLFRIHFAKFFHVLLRDTRYHIDVPRAFQRERAAVTLLEEFVNARVTENPRQSAMVIGCTLTEAGTAYPGRCLRDAVRA